jgi:hypothetical protein
MTIFFLKRMVWFSSEPEFFFFRRNKNQIYFTWKICNLYFKFYQKFLKYRVIWCIIFIFHFKKFENKKRKNIILMNIEWKNDNSDLLCITRLLLFSSMRNNFKTIHYLTILLPCKCNHISSARRWNYKYENTHNS